MKNLERPDQIQTNALSPDKASKRELMRHKLIEAGLIVDDGYDYESATPPEILPTLFHGTSAWFREDIEKDGLNPYSDRVDLEEVFAFDEQLKDIYKRMIADDGGGLAHGLHLSSDKSWEMRKKVFGTFSELTARDYAKDGSEAIRHIIQAFKSRYSDFIDTTKEDWIHMLGEIDTPAKKALMSVLQPRPMIVRIKAPVTCLDAEGMKKIAANDDYLHFVHDTEARLKLFSDIDKALTVFDKYDTSMKKDNSPGISMEEAGVMWKYLQASINKIGREGIGDLTKGELIEVYIRDKQREIFLNAVPPEFLEIEKT